MNPRDITFYSESNPKAAKAANKKAKVKQLWLPVTPRKQLNAWSKK